MNDKQKIAELEAVLAQFLNPIKNIPFPLIMKSISGIGIIPIERNVDADRQLVETLVEVAQTTSALVHENPIRRNRPNEVGNDIEPFVIEACRKNGLEAERPKTVAGKLKTTGYPDILISDKTGRPTYVECKIFGEGSDLSSMRSFYLSPSDDFKVTVEARHILMAFGVEREPINGSRDSLYRPKSFKLVDLFGLKCDVKYEFNSDNKRLYEDAILLASGNL
jgi:hypothetical protein